MSAISAVQCRFLAGAKVSAARKTVRARAAAVAPVAKFGCVRGKSMPLRPWPLFLFARASEERIGRLPARTTLARPGSRRERYI